jgi:DNA-binding MarR family transcriptional regulator
MEEICAKYLIEDLPSILFAIKQNCDRHQSFSDLTLQQYRLLSSIEKTRKSTTELAQEFAISLPAISRMSQLLVQRELVKKEIGSGDQRQITLSLTPHGRSLFKACREKYFATLIPCLSELKTKQKKTLIEAFQILDEMICAQEA